jgi:hypothetical protein
MIAKRIVNVLFFISISISSARSQPSADFLFHEKASYNSAVPSPADFLGYQLGDHYTAHHRVVDYAELLAEKSSRVGLETYGETNEGRKLILLIISSEKNLSRLEEIQKNLAALRQPAEWKDAGKISKIVEASPVIFWLSYNVHGNEPSSSEAAMQVAYQLAAGTDDKTESLLRDVVIIIDPMLNPDGRERYVNWFNSVNGQMKVVDPQSREHQEPWPGGRTNHYYFDLNRDWAWLTQVESQARMKAYRKWYPQGFIDFHEMGYNSSYFFFPAHGPIHSAFPKETAEWGKIYGKGNAAAFDARGWFYYTEEDFDLFYPGYGDSWPSLNGAIGMTYEQGGHAAGGLHVERDDGTILSLRERIAHHFTASTASLETTQKNRQRRLEDFHRFWKEGYETAARNPVQTYVILSGRDDAKTSRAMQLLLDQGIEVWQSDAELNARGATSYFSGKSGDMKFPAGSFLVHTQQPASRLVEALFDREPAVLDTFFYDITAWCFPAAFDLETYTLSPRPQVAAHVLETSLPSATSLDRPARYAFLLPWEQSGAPAAVFALMDKGYRVYTSQKPFTLSNKDYLRGTIIIPVAENGNPDSLAAMLKSLSARHRVRFEIADGGQTEKGIDLGSSNIRYVKPPQIAVIADEMVDDNSFGAIWFLFDKQLGRGFSTLSCEQLKSAMLKKYSVIVFPHSWSSYGSKIDSSVTARLKSWVQDGGVLIGLQGGAAFLASDAAKLSSVKIKKTDTDDEKARKEKEKAEAQRLSRMKLEEKEKESLRHEISGAIMKFRLDNTHPLGFGLPDTIYAMKTAKAVFDLTDKAHNVAIYAKSPKFAGFLSKKNAEWIGDTAAVTSEAVGRGRIILFADDPNFRHFWSSMMRLFTNAVVFGRLE